MSRRKSGICKITGDHDVFVKCHLIPQALTRPVIKGAPLYQSSHGTGPVRRWTSWYDGGMVCRRGEDYFSQIDDSAIIILREKELIWSGWKGEEINYDRFEGSTTHGTKTIKLTNKESRAIVLFIYSVMWRCSVSELKDLKDFSLGEETENKIKKYILGEEEVDPTLLPISLNIFPTKVERYNRIPTHEVKPAIDIDGSITGEIEFMRLFIDGLIVHANQISEPKPNVLEQKSLFLGYAPNTVVTAIAYEASAEREIFWEQLAETYGI